MEDNANLPEEEKKLNFPLQVRFFHFSQQQIVVNEGGMEEREQDFNRDFILNLLRKIDWKALKMGATDVGSCELQLIEQIGYSIPDEQPAELTDEILQHIHHALLELEVMEGKLVCRHCGREYIVEQGIPNMLLREDEV